MQKKFRILSAVMAGSLALAVVATAVSSGTGSVAKHAHGKLAVSLSAANAADYDETDPYQTGCANGAAVVSYSHCHELRGSQRHSGRRRCRVLRPDS